MFDRTACEVCDPAAERAGSGIAPRCRTPDPTPFFPKGFMMHVRILLSTALALTIPVSSPTPSTERPPVNALGAWRPASGLEQVPLWPGDAPNGTFRPQPPESVQIYDDAGVLGGKSEAVLNIAVPTMTIMPVKGRKTGTAVIVFPGGGFQKVLSGLKVRRFAIG